MTRLATTSEANYSAAYLASLDETKRLRFVQSLSPKKAEALLYDWRFWARPKQLPPEGDWFCWLLRSGRGFGKTRTGAEWVVQRAKDGLSPIALIGQTKADVRDTMVELGDSAILNISPPWFRPDYEPSKRRLTWPNGSIGIIYSGDEPDQLRGPQHASAWLDELAKFKYPQQTWDNMELGLRVGPKPQVVVTTTPRPIKILKQLLADPDVVQTQGSLYENAPNLPERFMRRVLNKYENTRLGRQEVHGEILDDDPDALWKREADIEAHRVVKPPDMERLVVAVDPSATATGDEAGIIVAGKAKVDDRDHLFVLEDVSMQASPALWAKAAVTAYHVWRADRIVAEKNNGGEMVSHTIGTVPEAKNVLVELVWASRGKQTRAEPVAALYEQGRGHHVGTFSDLEDELCQWKPGQPSPNRLDALVWAATELMLGESDSGGKLGSVTLRVRQR